MAGAFTTYLELKDLDLLFGVTAFTPPATMYLGISTSTIAAAGTGITEPVAMAYARITFTNNKTSWSVASGSNPGTLSNAIIYTFSQATGNWGIITDFFISDAITGGNILVYGSLTAPKTIANGDTARFAIGDFVINLI
jgi:hypothetical protein